MSTTAQPLKYLWSAQFADGSTMEQPADDRSVNHDDEADYNGTAFTDLLNHPADVVAFGLSIYVLSLVTGEFFIFTDPTNPAVPTSKFSLEGESEHLTDRKLIYYRVVRQHQKLSGDIDNIKEETEAPYVHAYVMGYEGKDTNGNVVKKTILVE